MSGELAAKLRPGELLDVGTPMGRFRTAVSAARAHSYVAFAAGSGITPILSLATDILAREPRSRFTLIYGNSGISRTMFLEETLALKNRYIDRFAVHFVMSREPQQTEWLNGRIDGRKVRELAQHMAEVAAADEYLICGPGDMVDELRNAIKDLNGTAPIRFERFAAAAPPLPPSPPRRGRAIPASERTTPRQHAKYRHCRTRLPCLKKCWPPFPSSWTAGAAAFRWRRATPRYSTLLSGRASSCRSPAAQASARPAARESRTAPP